MVVKKRKVVIDTHHWMAYNLGTTRTYLMLEEVESKINSEIELPTLRINSPGSNIPKELEKLKSIYPNAEFILLDTNNTV